MSKINIIINTIKETRKSFLSLADQAVVSIANFATGVIIGRSCSEEQFGLYMLAFTIISFSMNCQGSLILTPYTIQRPRLNDNEIDRYTGSTLVHQLLCSGVILFLLLIAFVSFSFGYGPEGMLDVVEMLILGIVFILLWDYVRRINFAAFNVRAALILDTVIGVLQVCALLLLAHFGWITAARGVGVIGAVCALLVVSWIYINRRNFRVLMSGVVPDFKSNFVIGKWIFASGLLWTVGSSIYPWLLANSHGIKITGIWAACVGVTRLCNPLLIGLQNYIRPKIALAFKDGNVEKLRQTCLESMGVFCLCLAPFFLILLLFGDGLVATFYGDKYGGNGLVVSLLGFNLLFSGLIFPPSRALFTIGRADIDFKINLCSLLWLCSFGVFLVHSYDLLGVCVALLISNVVSFIATYWCFHITLKEPNKVGVALTGQY